MASQVYNEQDGTNRQLGGNRGEITFRYTSIAPTRALATTLEATWSSSTESPRPGTFHNLTYLPGQGAHLQHRSGLHHENRVQTVPDPAGQLDGGPDLTSQTVSGHRAPYLAGNDQAVSARAAVWTLCSMDNQVWRAHGLSFTKYPPEVGRCPQSVAGGRQFPAGLSG